MPAESSRMNGLALPGQANAASRARGPGGVARVVRQWWPGGLFLLGLLALMEAMVAVGVLKAVIVPPPSVFLLRVVELVASGEFFSPVLASVSILLVGWLGASFLAVVVGMLMGFFKPAYWLLEPLVELLRPIPKPALIPPLMLLFGLGVSMKIAIVTLGAFFPVLIATVQAVRGMDPVQLDVGRTFRVGTWRTLWRIVLPACLPMILSGMKVSLSLALVLVVLAEMLTGSGGLGAIIIDLQRLFRVADMYAWIVILAVTGLALVMGFEALERRLVFWLGRG